MAREVCIRLQNGTLFCSSSPVRDCGCKRDENYKDPFPDVPSTITAESTLADLQGLLKGGGGSGDPEEWKERLRVIMVTARLVLQPGVRIMQPFVITAMDPHLPGSPATAE